MSFISALAAVFAGFSAIAFFYLVRERRKARQAKRNLESKLSAERESARAWSTRLEEAIGVLEARIAHLSRWESVADADEKAAELIRDAQAAARQLRLDSDRQVADAAAAAEEIRLSAHTEATSIVAAARNQAAKLGDQSRSAIAAAQEAANAVIVEANRRAEEIAGTALRAAERADEYERTVRALQNAIEGYGDRYIVPTHTLLDDLADDVGHVEAGQRLKATRNEIRERVRNGAVAECDYVEANRRETAIRFIVDAFNGKVDSILARVRSDNAGTLSQELRDAFTLVNHNGQAFRNARIRDDYLVLRLEELRWAAVATELKAQEREEQRRIQDQLREEEKARREYERAMRNAAKEEELVRRAMAKAEQAMAKANDEQKVKYELQLVELAQKLQAAEARNQRALSMAQQTRRGHVYVISNLGSLGENVYKIGLTRRLEPLDRIRELGDSSVPFEFDVHALIFSDDAPALETKLHRHFALAQLNKVNHRKEFFRTDLAHIRAEIEGLGLSAKWTMAAEAREYRESLAIENAIAEDPAKRDAWLRRQLSLEPASDDELGSSVVSTQTSIRSAAVPVAPDDAASVHSQLST